jgi:hypothetical protein
MQGMREQFEVKDDAEWKLISERVTKVMEARRAASSSGMGGSGFSGGFGGPRPQGGDRGGDRGTNRFQGGPPGFNREPNPELDALRKSIDAKASPAELKAKLAQLRAARQKKEAELEKARDELRIVLSVRQEAMAVASGLLK